MHKSETHSGTNKLLLIALGALGVVYGDIGTSPLYAINEIFFGHSHTLINQANVLGAISLVFWAITIVICFKYVFLVLRADNDGEGGVYPCTICLLKRPR
jgi:KUP system potassium uptake protein